MFEFGKQEYRVSARDNTAISLPIGTRFSRCKCGIRPTLRSTPPVKSVPSTRIVGHDSRGPQLSPIRTCLHIGWLAAFPNLVRRQLNTAHSTSDSISPEMRNIAYPPFDYSATDKICIAKREQACLYPSSAYWRLPTSHSPPLVGVSWLRWRVHRCYAGIFCRALAATPAMAAHAWIPMEA